MRLLLLPGLALLLGGCTVYAPMQPTLPLLTERGEGEVSASLQPSGRLEITGAYSPRDRLVVLGGLTGAPRLGEQQYLKTLQYELGAGVYQPLGSWVLGAQVGGGQAYSHRAYDSPGFPFIVAPSHREYEASYWKQFVQVGAGFQGVLRSFSVTYRLTRVQFNYLNDADYGPLPLRYMLRHELALGTRTDLFGSERWQLAGTTGLSLGSSAVPDYPYPIGGRVADNLGPALFVSLGVVYRLGTYW